jgi:hypothetical protein
MYSTEVGHESKAIKIITKVRHKETTMAVATRV